MDKDFFQKHKTSSIGIIIIVAVIVGIQVLNYIVSLQNQNKQSDEKTNSVEFGYDKEVISGDSKGETAYKSETDILQNFVDCCNNKDYEKAYNLLTDECKEVLYPNIDLFEKNYCESLFSNKKTCGFQAWNGYTYMVEIRDDIMSSGNYNQNDYIREYYTVSGEKLNIKGYIGRENVMKQSEKNGVIVQITSIDYFMDNTKVNFNVINNRDKIILMDIQENGNCTTMIDENNVEFTSKTPNMPQNDLIVNNNDQKKITIDFDISYRSDLQWNWLDFKKIILNYDEYSKGNTAENMEMKAGF